MVAIGVVAVLVLYGLTLISGRADTATNSATAPQQTASESSGGELPDSLQAQVSALEAEGTASAWARLGHLYFTAAIRATDAERAAFASRAVDAFDLSLAIEENADIRTSMAEAAQFDQRNPMRAVQELQTVLATSPDHVAANYLLGALRARIGRLDDAAESFQRVIELTPAEDPIHQRAAQDLAGVQQRMAAAPSSG
jgi:cytochrome c-type biogenesis protein CcmH/NrfG